VRAAIVGFGKFMNHYPGTGGLARKIADGEWGKRRTGEKALGAARVISEKHLKRGEKQNWNR